jgi:hypothetical protein
MEEISMKRLSIIVIIGALALNVTSFSASQAQSNVYKLHSLFVYNFVKNIKWEHVGEEFVIGVYNNATVMKEFNANFDSKNIGGKKFNIKQINSAAEASSCQIVYIPKTNRVKTTELISELSGPQILVVTEEDMVKEGASISFELVESKLNFKINKSNTEEKGLKVSSSLLALGTVI